jgi:hypothetical protein
MGYIDLWASLIVGIYTEGLGGRNFPLFSLSRSTISGNFSMLPEAKWIAAQELLNT